jgi:two-component system, NarL family, nitrate/nitrite response regulator NarL
VTRRVRAFIIAQTRLYREALEKCLDEEGRIEVVGAAAEPERSLETIAAAAPDVVLVDMAGLGSADGVRAVAAALPDVTLVGLAVPDTEEDVVSCAEAGITGYVPRDGSYKDLVDAVERGARGEAVGSPRVVAGLMRRVAALADERDEASRAALTRRELQIVRLIDEGQSNKEIAAQLSIELATVKNHVHHILEKLHVTRRGEAAARVRGMRR